VPTPIEQLDSAFADVEAASGADFFRRLRDYNRLICSDETILEATGQMQHEVELAEGRLQAEDGDVLRDLTRCRGELTERAPDLDDSGEQRPAGRLLDPEARPHIDRWAWTLSNFDAIVPDREDKIVKGRNLDRTTARMLAEILFAKLHNALYPGQRITPQRPELESIYDVVCQARNRHQAAQTHLEEVTQGSGFLALRQVGMVASHLEPRDTYQPRNEEERQAFAESLLLEVSGEFHHLRDAVRPEAARGPLSADARAAIERREPDCRNDLADLHRALRPRVEEVERENAPRGWSALDTSQRIQVAAIGVALLGIIVGGLIAIATAG
jgi:hypothetical protein